MLKWTQTATPILEASSATYYTAKHTFSTNKLRRTVAYPHTQAFAQMPCYVIQAGRGLSVSASASLGLEPLVLNTPYL